MGSRGASKGGGGGGGGAVLPPIGGADKDKKKISDQVYESVAKGIARVEKALGVNGLVREIIPEPMAANTYAACRIATGTLFLNTRWYSDEAKMKAQYERDVKSTWHPAGTTWENVVDHETGHALEKIVNEAYMKKNNISGSGSKYWDYFFKQKGIGDIVKEAVATTKSGIKKETGNVMSANDIKQSLSRYSLKNYHETFAEAIADYTANGNNANRLSKEIVRITKEVLK